MLHFIKTILPIYTTHEFGFVTRKAPFFAKCKQNRRATGLTGQGTRSRATRAIAGAAAASWYCGRAPGVAPAAAPPPALVAAPRAALCRDARSADVTAAVIIEDLYSFIYLFASVFIYSRSRCFAAVRPDPARCGSYERVPVVPTPDLGAASAGGAWGE